jgi:signal transduction histidine kinase
MRSRSGGTGLGLALCRHFIETGHGGTVGAHSRVGDGSELYFEVPLAPASVEDRTAPAPGAMTPGAC